MMWIYLGIIVTFVLGLYWLGSESDLDTKTAVVLGLAVLAAFSYGTGYGDARLLYQGTPLPWWGMQQGQVYKILGTGKVKDTEWAILEAAGGDDPRILWFDEVPDSTGYIKCVGVFDGQSLKEAVAYTPE